MAASNGTYAEYSTPYTVEKVSGQEESILGAPGVQDSNNGGNDSNQEEDIFGAPYDDEDGDDNDGNTNQPPGTIIELQATPSLRPPKKKKRLSRYDSDLYALPSLSSQLSRRNSSSSASQRGTSRLTMLHVGVTGVLGIGLMATLAFLIVSNTKGKNRSFKLYKSLT